MASEARKNQAIMEDEDDLFEIDLDAVDKIPPPRYLWERDVTATQSALLANCLLPISDLSSAVPMVSGTCGALTLSAPGSVVMIGETLPLGKLLQLSFLACSLGVQFHDMKA